MALCTSTFHAKDKCCLFADVFFRSYAGCERMGLRLTPSHPVFLRVSRFFTLLFICALIFAVPKARCLGVVTENAMSNKRQMKRLIDDGFAPELVAGAFFDGMFEIPIIKNVPEVFVPKRLVPFTKRGVTSMIDEFICFYEHDFRFSDVLRNARAYLECCRKFSGLVSPDCSLYRDMPLVLQIVNTYFNRALGHYFQSNGLRVVANVRWGDERSYTRALFPEPFAFAGVERNAVVSVGTYGCSTGHENAYHRQKGLAAMFEELSPRQVWVYGAYADDEFAEYKRYCDIRHFQDWTTAAFGRGGHDGNK